MIQTVHNSTICQTMELFNEIDDISDLFMLERNPKLDASVEEYQDLQTKYSCLHENYAKEIENSKKVERCLVKCLKFYSKLCKKYEAQQKIITSLEERVKEKVACLEESLRNQEKLRGLIEVYKSERNLYSGATNESLRRDREVLLDICCRLINESVKSYNIKSLTNLILRKFRKDLDDDKLNLLKGRNVAMKKEECKDSEVGSLEDLKPPDFLNLKGENLEENFWGSKPKEEKQCDELNGLVIKKCEDIAASRKVLDGHYLEESDKCMHNDLSQEDTNEFSSQEATVEGDYVPYHLPAHDEGVLNFGTTQLECDHLDSHFSDIVERTNESVGGGVETMDVNVRTHTHLGSVEESSESQPECPLSIDEEGCTITNQDTSRIVNSSSPRPTVNESGSIFDIPDMTKENNGYLKENILNIDGNRKEKCISSDAEISLYFDASVERQSIIMSSIQDSLCDKTTLNNSADISQDLQRIFVEMSHFRLLSPIKEINQSPSQVKTGSVSLDSSRKSEDVCRTSGRLRQKRDWDSGESCGRVKKLKGDNEREVKANCDLLDSILSAMSVQNEEFKQNVVSSVPVSDGEPKTRSSAEGRTDYTKFSRLGTKTYSRRNKLANPVSSPKKTPPSEEPKIKKDKEVEKLVMDEIKSFVSSPMLSSEEADKNVKHCLSVLENKSEEIIARSIVSIVLENVDEDVEIFERPIPPLTKTQHRLMVLLSVFRTLDSNSDKVTSLIMSMLTEKLFPDNFFWPDDCVETSCRFYTALCKGRNDAKALWKFCLQAMTDMKQRSCLVVFTALKTWPDVLHNASTLKNNILALTIVNLFLHMPKAEGQRNLNQKKKLMALKHLLMNFYQFKVEETVEAFSKRVLESLLRGEVGSERSLVLLSRCREKSWTCKYILSKLRETLVEWMEDRVENSVASRVLAVIKQIVPFMRDVKDGGGYEIKQIISCLSGIVSSRKMNHESELEIVGALLELKQYPEARRIIREWVPKTPISESLRNEIVNVSAVNILRELKLNRRKESLGKKSCRKQLKKQSKKSKGKKRKGKARKGKINEGKLRIPPTPGVV